MTKRLSYLSLPLLLPLLFIATILLYGRVQAGGADVCTSGPPTCTYGSIQDAATNGPENTPLLIEAGTYFENVEITRSVIFQGKGPDSTIIDGQLMDTAVLINGDPTISISGLTIRNGDSTLEGGGVLNEAGQVTLADVIVEENMAPFGAGITNNDVMVLDDVIVRNNVADEVVGFCEDCAGGGIYNLSVMTITNSIIHGNSAKFGGGIENASAGTFWATGIDVYSNSAEDAPDEASAGGGIENFGTVTLTNISVRNNDAPIGAGVSNGGTLTISGSDIYGNIADTRGGGIHNSFNLTVQTSNVYDNEAGSGGGGGISSESGDVMVVQTAVYSNSATGNGGGIVHNVDPVSGDNSFVITNSTLSGNSAIGTGGGIRNAGIASTELNNVTLNNNSSIVGAGQSVSVAGGTLEFKNSIINSAGTDCSGSIGSNGYNIASDNSCGLGGTADLVSANPQLGPLQNNGGSSLTHALLLGSPAIDSGSGCPAVDQRGVARPAGAECDRGAYEFSEENVTVYLPFVLRP
ncbi:choice-of-anchor Q domain-containing protein [Candidatus Leptofilum sp.]|uniref:choice-of-anchor Q domain-containing protein n=1 Tax=Candidatus Leptofilum sp. TaxID=3241576 RepID=UPI003B590269